MTSSFPRIAAAAIASVGTFVAGFFLWQVHSLSTDGVFDAPSVIERGLASASLSAGKAANSGFPALITLDDILTDVRSKDEGRIHSLNLKVELELFEEEGRASIEKVEPALKNVIIETIRSQTLERLNTLSGKLYFKEVLISKMNGVLHQPVIRDLHFSSFFLQ